MNKTLLVSLCAAAGLMVSTAAQALVIDTNPTWDGSTNNGWYGSGQSLTIDATDNWLHDISFYFAPDSAGHVFNFSISDALTGGTAFYATSFAAVAGINTFTVDHAFTAGSTIYALFDYNGFSGSTANYSNNDGYAGGHSFFLSGSQWAETFASLDHRFIANFADGPDANAPAVPLPATLPLVLGGFGLMALARRRNA